MGKTQKPLFTVITPYVGASEVTLYASTWYGHIVLGHPEMKRHLGNVKNTIAQPGAIIEDEKGGLIFCSATTTTQAGAPLAVVVDQTLAIVKTAFFNRNYITIDAGTMNVVWSK